MQKYLQYAIAFSPPIVNVANIQAGRNLPATLAEHPIYETSGDEYRTVRQRVEHFVELVENNQASVLELTAGDINCLRNRGVTPVKSNSNGVAMPEYYEIRDCKIYQHSLAFFPFSPKFFLSLIHKISFIEKEGKLSESQRTISENDKIRQSEQPVVYSLAKSKLLDCILRQDKTFAWSEAMTKVIRQLEQIEIQNDSLLLITQPLESPAEAVL